MNVADSLVYMACVWSRTATVAPLTAWTEPPSALCRPAYVSTVALTVWFRFVSDEALNSSTAMGLPIPRLRTRALFSPKLAAP